jgi:hypothetical protein
MFAEKGETLMTDKDTINPNEQCCDAHALPAIEPPQCDIEKYGEYIKNFELSEQEKAELLKTLWMMMAAFVDLGIGVDSIRFLSSSPQKQQSIPA